MRTCTCTPGPLYTIVMQGLTPTFEKTSSKGLWYEMEDEFEAKKGIPAQMTATAKNAVLLGTVAFCSPLLRKPPCVNFVAGNNDVLCITGLHEFYDYPWLCVWKKHTHVRVKEADRLYAMHLGFAPAWDEANFPGIDIDSSDHNGPIFYKISTNVFSYWNFTDLVYYDSAARVVVSLFLQENAKSIEMDDVVGPIVTYFINMARFQQRTDRAWIWKAFLELVGQGTCARS